MRTEDAGCGPRVVIPLPNGRRAHVTVCSGTLGPYAGRPTFDVAEVTGAHAEDVEHLAHGLLALVRELRHPEGVQQAPVLPPAVTACDCRHCKDARGEASAAEKELALARARLTLAERRLAAERNRGLIAILTLFLVGLAGALVSLWFVGRSAG